MPATQLVITFVLSCAVTSSANTKDHPNSIVSGAFNKNSTSSVTQGITNLEGNLTKLNTAATEDYGHLIIEKGAEAPPFIGGTHTSTSPAESRKPIHQDIENGARRTDDTGRATRGKRQAHPSLADRHDSRLPDHILDHVVDRLTPRDRLRALMETEWRSFIKEYLSRFSADALQSGGLAGGATGRPYITRDELELRERPYENLKENSLSPIHVSDKQNSSYLAVRESTGQPTPSYITPELGTQDLIDGTFARQTLDSGRPTGEQGGEGEGGMKRKLWTKLKVNTNYVELPQKEFESFSLYNFVTHNQSVANEVAEGEVAQESNFLRGKDLNFQQPSHGSVDGSSSRNERAHSLTDDVQKGEVYPPFEVQLGISLPINHTSSLRLIHVLRVNASMTSLLDSFRPIVEVDLEAGVGQAHSQNSSESVNISPVFLKDEPNPLPQVKDNFQDALPNPAKAWRPSVSPAIRSQDYPFNFSGQRHSTFHTSATGKDTHSSRHTIEEHINTRTNSGNVIRATVSPNQGGNVVVPSETYGDKTSGVWVEQTDTDSSSRFLLSVNLDSILNDASKNIFLTEETKAAFSPVLQPKVPKALGRDTAQEQSFHTSLLKFKPSRSDLPPTKLIPPANANPISSLVRNANARKRKQHNTRRVLSPLESNRESLETLTLSSVTPSFSLGFPASKTRHQGKHVQPPDDKYAKLGASFLRFLDSEDRRDNGEDRRDAIHLRQNKRDEVGRAADNFQLNRDEIDLKGDRRVTNENVGHRGNLNLSGKRGVELQGVRRWVETKTSNGQVVRAWKDALDSVREGTEDENAYRSWGQRLTTTQEARGKLDTDRNRRDHVLSPTVFRDTLRSGQRGIRRTEKGGRQQYIDGKLSVFIDTNAGRDGGQYVESEGTRKRKTTIRGRRGSFGGRGGGKEANFEEKTRESRKSKDRKNVDLKQRKGMFMDGGEGTHKKEAVKGGKAFRPHPQIFGGDPATAIHVVPGPSFVTDTPDASPLVGTEDVIT